MRSFHCALILLCSCAPATFGSNPSSKTTDSCVDPETGATPEDSAVDDSSSDSGVDTSVIVAPELSLVAVGAAAGLEDRMVGGYDDGYGGWVAALYAGEACPLTGHESRSGVVRTYLVPSMLQLGTICGLQDGDMIEYDGLVCAPAADGSLSCFPPDAEGYAPDEAYRRVAGMSSDFGYPVSLGGSKVAILSPGDRDGVAMDEIPEGTSGAYMFEDYSDELCEEGMLCGVSGTASGDVLLLAAPGGRFYAHTLAGASGDGWPARWTWTWGSLGSERTRTWLTSDGDFLVSTDGSKSTRLNPETGYETEPGSDAIGGYAMVSLDEETFDALAYDTQVCVGDSCVELSVEVTDLAPCGVGCVAAITQAGALMVFQLSRSDAP